jgi:hypothetical protein
MRKTIPNKVQATRVEQGLKSLEVGIKSYLGDRDADLKALVTQSTQNLLTLIDQDWDAFQKYEHGKLKTYADMSKK